MNCPNCRKPLSTKYTECPYCGTYIHSVTPEIYSIKNIHDVMNKGIKEKFFPSTLIYYLVIASIIFPPFSNFIGVHYHPVSSATAQLLMFIADYMLVPWFSSNLFVIGIGFSLELKRKEIYPTRSEILFVIGSILLSIYYILSKQNILLIALVTCLFLIKLIINYISNNK